MAGSGAPQGRAERVDGGYRVLGKFGWASGIDRARWVYGGCLVHRDGVLETDAEGRPIYLLAFAPKNEASVEEEGWNVGGLVATNSTSFTLDAVFVPAAHTLRVPWDSPQHTAPLFRLPRRPVGDDHARRRDRLLAR